VVYSTVANGGRESMNIAKERAKKKLLHCFDHMSGFTLENDSIKASIESVVDLIVEAAIEELQQQKAGENECLEHIQNPFPPFNLL
jgi:hypothetical protein